MAFVPTKLKYMKISCLCMPKLVKDEIINRKSIEIRITTDFKLIDKHFQIYCIKNKLNETKEIRKMIEEYLKMNEALPGQKTLSEF